MNVSGDKSDSAAARFRQVIHQMRHNLAPMATDVTHWVQVTMEMVLWMFDQVLIDRFQRRSMVRAKEGALEIHLKELNLHEKTYQALLDLGLKTIGDVVETSPVEILSAPGFGRARWEQLKAALRACGVESWPGDFQVRLYERKS